MGGKWYKELDNEESWLFIKNITTYRRISEENKSKEINVNTISFNIFYLLNGVCKSLAILLDNLKERYNKIYYIIVILSCINSI